MSLTELFSDVVSSSVWRQDDSTRIVWITLLSLKNANHIVPASVADLAHVAGVSVEECRKAIENLSAPDHNARTEAHQGRRIEQIDGGFLILNGAVYRKKRDKDQERRYRAAYMRAYRRKQKESA